MRTSSPAAILLFLSLALLQPALAQNIPAYGTSFDQREIWLLHYYSIFKDRRDGESRDAYLARIARERPMDENGRRVITAHSLLRRSGGMPDVTLPAIYMQLYYPEPNDGEAALTSDFLYRRLTIEGEKKLAADIAALPFEEEQWVDVSITQNQYDFDRERFRFSISVDNVPGPPTAQLQTQVPIAWHQDYSKRLATVEMPIEVAEAEKLSSRMAQNGHRGRLYFTLHERFREPPIYLESTLGMVFLHTFEYTPARIEFYLGSDYQKENVFYVFTDFPEIAARTVEASALGPAGAAPPGSIAAARSGSPSFADPADFVRHNRRGLPYIQYAGELAAPPGGLLRLVRNVQLEISYGHYGGRQDHALRSIGANGIVGGVWLQLTDGRVVQQALGEPVFGLDSYTWLLGIGPYAEGTREAGFEGISLRVLYRDDHHLDASLLDGRGMPVARGTLLALPKDDKPPFSDR